MNLQSNTKFSFQTNVMFFEMVHPAVHIIRVKGYFYFSQTQLYSFV
jgi:hypothetical protein